MFCSWACIHRLLRLVCALLLYFLKSHHECRQCMLRTSQIHKYTSLVYLNVFLFSCPPGKCPWISLLNLGNYVDLSLGFYFSTLNTFQLQKRIALVVNALLHSWHFNEMTVKVQFLPMSRKYCLLQLDAMTLTVLGNCSCDDSKQGALA